MVSTAKCKGIYTLLHAFQCRWQLGHYKLAKKRIDVEMCDGKGFGVGRHDDACYDAQ